MNAQALFFYAGRRLRRWDETLQIREEVSHEGASDFVRERAARSEIRDACERRVQNCSQGLAGEERLMPGHDHVRERDEALDHVVRDHRAISSASSTSMPR
jgi:hypothetical protein